MDDHSNIGDLPQLQMRGISKAYPGVQALDGVDLDLRKGEILGLVGENGAGKSTLIKIIAGALPPDRGTIRIDGEDVILDSPRTARKYGIAIIHQEMSLIPTLRVWENIFLSRHGWVHRREERREAARLVGLMGLEINPDAYCKQLSVGEQQAVEIASAIRVQSNILVLDEPTASLSKREVVRLHELLIRLRKQGIAIIYISHRLEEITELCDRVQVLRDGCTQGVYSGSSIIREDLIQSMIGKRLVGEFPPRASSPGSTCLELIELSRRGVVRDISLHVRRGEILGITGLVGSGRSELLRLMCGADQPTSGMIKINEVPVRLNNPREALAAGVCLLPEDRKAAGLFLGRSTMENFSIPNLSYFSTGGFLNRSKESKAFAKYVKSMKLPLHCASRMSNTLSGGNQQKLLFARWLCRQCDVILLDEPTRGIDIAARYEIYQLVRTLTDQGKSIVMVSSDLAEVIGMANRILVMRDGAVAGELDNLNNLSQSDVLALAYGATDAAKRS